jgi:hypothetical protein
VREKGIFATYDLSTGLGGGDLNDELQRGIDALVKHTAWLLENGMSEREVEERLVRDGINRGGARVIVAKLSAARDARRLD